MKIVFLSTFALDANVSLINSLSKKCDVYFFTEALYEVFNFINKDKLNKTITLGTEVEDLQKFENMLDLQKTYVVKGVRNSNVLKKISNSYQVHKLIKKINPDVIIIDNYMLTYFFSTVFYRKKMLLVVHDPFLHSGENFIIDQYLRKLHFSLIKNKILLNENQKESFVQHYKQNPENTFTSFLSVYNYLTCFLDNDIKKNENFNVLFFGRISPYKGIKFLLDAFLEILEKNPYANISLTIAGSGNFDFDILEYKKHPEIKVLNYYIQPQELAKLIYDSSVVVCPYTDATQSGVVMSSFAFKKPVIATNVGGLPEMVEDGKTGLIIAPKNSKEISLAILRLYNDKKLLKEMSENIENDYFSGPKSWAGSAHKFIEALSKINNK
jgi:glycosyltransferase involved in cell wall biosynthesis